MKTSEIVLLGGVGLAAYLLLNKGISNLTSANPQNVETRQEEMTERTDIRQEEMTERTDIRQDQKTERTQIRNETYKKAIDTVGNIVKPLFENKPPSANNTKTPTKALTYIKGTQLNTMSNAYKNPYVQGVNIELKKGYQSTNNSTNVKQPFKITTPITTLKQGINLARNIVTKLKR